MQYPGTAPQMGQVANNQVMPEVFQQAPLQNNGMNYRNYMTPLGDKFHVKQRVNMKEVMLNFEAANIYDVQFNGNNVMLAAERTGMGFFCFRNKGGRRPFIVDVKDARTHQDLLRLDRPFSLYTSKMTVFDSTNDEVVAYVEEKLYPLFQRNMDVQDGQGKLMFKVKAPCLKPNTFEFTRPGEDDPAGKVVKEFGGFLKEYFTDADNFRVELPQDMPEQEKASLLASAVLIDFMYFERAPKKNKK